MLDAAREATRAIAIPWEVADGLEEMIDRGHSGQFVIELREGQIVSAKQQRAIRVHDAAPSNMRSLEFK